MLQRLQENLSLQWDHEVVFGYVRLSSGCFGNDWVVAFDRVRTP